MKRLRTESNFYKEIVCLCSFLLPVLILAGIFISRGVHPLGNKCYICSDMFHQYFPFYTELIRKIKNGSSIFYSWNVGLGSNYIPMIAYNLASPLNVILLFFPEEYLLEGMEVLLILKTGLCGLTFSYYLIKKWNASSIFMIPFSLFYAMSGYMTAYSWNIMWIDGIILLPLIVLGVERLCYEKKQTLYIGMLALSIWCNYYISIFISIFVLLYFLVQIIVNFRKVDGFTKIEVFNCIERFVGSSLLAGAMSAVLLVPTAISLKGGAFAQFDFPRTCESYFSIFDMLARHCMNTIPELRTGHWPNLYCGSFMILLLPLYIMNSRIGRREKIGKVLLVGFLWLSFSINVLDYIWHGFNFPDCVPCRQAFVYVFLLLDMGYEVVRLREGISRKIIVESFTLAVVFLILWWRLESTDNFESNSFFITAVFITVYSILLIRYVTHEKQTNLIGIVVVTVAVLECCINTESTGFDVVHRDACLKQITSQNDFAEHFKDMTRGNFARIEEKTRVTKNDGMLADYHMATMFASTTPGAVSNWYSAYGMGGSRVYYGYNGATPFMSALLSVQYILMKEELPKAQLSAEQILKVERVSEGNRLYLYQLRQTLPLGYVVDSDSAFLLPQVKDPCRNQNELAKKLGAEADLFEPLEAIEWASTTAVSPFKAGHVFVYVTDPAIDTVIGSVNGDTVKFTEVMDGYLLDMGWCEAGSDIRLRTEDNKPVSASAYLMNQLVFSLVMKHLSENTVTVADYSDTRIKGTVQMSQEGILVLSVPFEKGWHLTVDGAKTEITAYQGAFLSAKLTEGDHDIQLNYCPEGIIVGAIISLMALMLYIVISISLAHTGVKKKHLTHIGRL